MFAAENKKITSLATKTVASLGSALKSAVDFQAELTQKLGLGSDDPQLASCKANVDELKAWKTAASAALQQQAKSVPKLDELPYFTEKEANGLIRLVAGEISALRPLMKKPKGSSNKKGKGKGENKNAAQAE